METTVNVIGAGLAGCEAAYQLIKRGIRVNLYEMKRKEKSPVQKSDLFAELVCSNSFRSSDVHNAIGLLKEEMKMLDSLIMRAADATKIKGGTSLVVDRNLFSSYVTDYLAKNPLVKIIDEEVTSIMPGPTIIATGPLTSSSLAGCITEYTGKDYLYFYDSVSPIVKADSINKDICYLKSRYDKGTASYWNCPLTEEKFARFYDALVTAERATPHDFEKKAFSGCMAIEEIADLGKDTLRFGPLKPVGLRKDGITPYAVVQLRQDDAVKSLYNLVGFQTHLKFPEQKRVLRLIPGLENVEIVRYGIMHRNTYIQSPGFLNRYYQVIHRPDLFFAGQITGVEGYIESAASGLVAGINMARMLLGKNLLDFTDSTVIGSLAKYISTPNNHFVPMNANFGLIKDAHLQLRRKARVEMYIKRSLCFLKRLMRDNNE